MIDLLAAVLLLVDGLHGLTSNERAEQLRETVESLLGEQADHYLVAGLLGLAEVLLGLALLVGVLRRGVRAILG